MIIFQSTWPQLDISSFSYQSYSVIALILLYLAAPFFTATGCFCLATYVQQAPTAQYSDVDLSKKNEPTVKSNCNKTVRINNSFK